MHVQRAVRLTIAAALILGAVAGAAAQPPRPGDWPQWRGPDRTNLSRETGLLKSWPPGGPRLVWKAEGLGGGYSMPSVADGRLYGMGYVGEEESVWALDAATGKIAWRTPIAVANRRIGYPEGSRCTPTVDGPRLYALGTAGDLVCLNRADGKLTWQKNLQTDFGGRIPNWGYAESPLVDGVNVIATPGGRANTLVALNKMDGSLVWGARVPQGDAAAYASCIIATIGGERQYLQFTAMGVVSVAAADGRFLWRFNSPATPRGINCSTPLFRDGHVFAAAAYNHGGALGKVEKSPAGYSVTDVYFSRDMQNHHGGMVIVGDHLYGTNNTALVCLNFKTGEVAWQDRCVGKGSLFYADGMLYVRGERGTMALVEATPTGYAERGRFEQPDRTSYRAWSHPVVAGGRLYLRDQDLLLAYDVKGS
jgi:outer membrane protein assembly factor BamB